MPKRTPAEDPRTAGPRTVGVEEELLLVDPRTGRPIAVSERLQREAEPDGTSLLESEVKQEQIEVISPPCTTLSMAAEAVVEGRRTADEAARRVDARAVALGTSVVAGPTHVTPNRRYLAMSSQFGITMREQLTCGCHVHVGIESDEEGVAVLDRIRPWLPALLALSGNSPFWRGEDSEYSSFRYQVWSRWPSSGPYTPFGSASGYRSRVRAMLATGVVRDTGMVYLDARLSDHVPTVEIRVPDVCMEVEHAVAIVALARAIVEAAADEWRRGVAPAETPTEVLRLAMWSASRFGLRGRLVDPRTGVETEARAVIEALLDHAEPALSASGDFARVSAAVSDAFRNGTGADRQRRVLSEGGGHRSVVADAIEVTHRGSSASSS